MTAVKEQPVTYVVSAPYQVHHAGRTYSSGDQVQAVPSVGGPWVAAGWAVEAKPAKKSAARAK